MKKCKVLFWAVLFILFGISGASAAPIINLFEWAVNSDGTVETAPLPFGPLGTVTITTLFPGPHYIAGFFDLEIDEGINTFFNEYGSANGAPSAGQSWEIDEPGYAFGDIYDNFMAGFLDNSNAIAEPLFDDVSMALGWNFVLGAGEKAVITLSLSQVAPTGGFFLAQIDPDSEATIYLSGDLRVTGGGTQVPEPGTILLLGCGLAGLVGLGRKKFRK